MTRIAGLFAAGCLLLAGCNKDNEVSNSTSAAPPASHTPSTGAPSAHAGSSANAAASAGTVAIKDGVAELNPSNTHIGWIGTHVGDKPDPRVGSFEKFTGTAEVDADAKKLKSVSLDIDTASLKSPIENLTTHLNSPDFLDTRQFPKATFKSTNIADDGTITGDLTLHGVTKEISFPANIAVSDAGLSIKAEFKINRDDFDLGQGQDRVEKDVAITVQVGGEASPALLGANAAGGGAQPPRGPGGQFNPEEFFARRDANSDGKLTGDEISDRMKQNLAETDKDGNGEISKEEFMARMSRFGGGRPGGGGRPAAGGNSGGGTGATDGTDRPSAGSP
jgi:polyisoprenoid-binding protein YceI